MPEREMTAEERETFKANLMMHFGLYVFWSRNIDEAAAIGECISKACQSIPEETWDDATNTAYGSFDIKIQLKAEITVDGTIVGAKVKG